MLVRSTETSSELDHTGGLSAGHSVIARHGPCVLPLSPPLLEAWENAFETNQEITYQSEAPQSYECCSLPKGRGF